MGSAARPGSCPYNLMSRYPWDPMEGTTDHSPSSRARPKRLEEAGEGAPAMLKVAIILGSTRPGRNGEAVAKWVHDIASRRRDATFELIDLRDFNLPLLDEPLSPVLGQYSQPHTKAWAAKIAE